MLRFGYIPLDARPVHTDQFVLLARAAGAEAILPPEPLLGKLTRGFRQGAAKKWLEKVPWAFPWIVSVDALSFGGLVQARQKGATFQTALGKLSGWLEIFRARRAKVHAFSFLPRLAPSVEGSAELKLWKEAHQLLSDSPRTIFEPFSLWAASFPEELLPRLEELYFVRRRNFHLLNVLLQQYVPEPIGTLLLLQEDTAPRGIHRAEVRALQEKIEGEGKEPFVSLQTGGDEAPYLLLSRMLAPEKRVLSTAFYPPEAADSVSLYEDKPQRAVVAEKASFLNLQLASAQEVSLAIFSSPHPQDALIDSRARLPVSSLLSEKRGRETSLPHGAWVVDNRQVNSGSLALLESLAQQGKLPPLFAFNTFANKLGMALSTWKLSHCSSDLFLLSRFFFLRLLDDYFYQGIFREEVQRISARLRADFWNFERERGEVERTLQPLLLSAWREFQKKLPPLLWEPKSISFPFGRGFEAGFRVGKVRSIPMR